MSYFSDLIDKIVLFICCLILYLCQLDLSISVVPVLVAIIFTGFLSYSEDERIRTAMTAGFAVLCYFVPALTIFIPLIGYDMLFQKYQFMNFIVIFPIVEIWQTASLLTSGAITILLFISILLKYRMDKQIQLQAKYNALSDATREMSIQLKKQNSDLLEKQDNELNIATLNERNRIAREIHDNVGHLLSSAILQVGALLTINKDAKMKEQLGTLKDTLSKGMNSIRNSVHNLFDESIDLNAQIEELLKQFGFCEVSYDYQISSNPDKKLKYAFVSIIKEALSNMINHSNATQASIRLREHPALYQLVITDNGTVKSYSMDNGMGLKNIMDRVHSFNGNINILTDNGFEIFITIPKEGDR